MMFRDEVLPLFFGAFLGGLLGQIIVAMVIWIV